MATASRWLRRGDSEGAGTVPRGACGRSDRSPPKIRQILSRFPGYDFGLNSFLTERIEETLSGQTADVAVSIFGDDLNALDRSGDEIARVLRGIRGGADVHVQAPGGMPQVVVRLRPNRLAQFGFEPLDVLSAIRAAYEGEMVAQTYDGNRIFGASVILDRASRRDPEAIGGCCCKTAKATSRLCARSPRFRSGPAVMPCCTTAGAGFRL